MLPTSLTEGLRAKIAAAAHPRELVVDVMLALQAQVGYLSDEAVAAAAELLRMTPLEIEELATFYTFIYREPVGRYVIHVCDSVICWMNGADSLATHLSAGWGSPWAKPPPTASSPSCRSAASATATGRRRSWSTSGSTAR
jgi:NADH-quinone oxidoreductase subunit E